MGSLAGCMKRLGITGGEATYIRSLVTAYREDGVIGTEAATRAVKDLIRDTEAERADVLTQLKAVLSPEDTRKVFGEAVKEQAVFASVAGSKKPKPTAMTGMQDVGEKINTAYKDLFETMQEKPTDHGTALFSIRPNLSRSPLSEAELHEVARRINVGTKTTVNVVPFTDLPAAIQEEAQAQGYPPSEIRGVFHDGSVYLVQGNISTVEAAEETVFHELYHAWVAGLLGDQKQASLSDLFQKIGGIESVLKLADQYHWDEARAIVKAYGKRTELSLAKRQALIVDELLATMGQRNENDGLGKWWKEFQGAIRNWLREHGFATLATWNEADLVHLLKQAKEYDARAEGSKAFIVDQGEPVFQPGKRGKEVVTIDSLNARTQEDILGHLADTVQAILERGYTPSDLRPDLFDLVKEPTVTLGHANPATLKKQFGENRGTSKAAVAKYRDMLRQGVEFDPVLLNNGKFEDGGNRVEAYLQEGRKTIPTVDIGSLLNMDWERWLSGKLSDQDYHPFQEPDTEKPLFHPGQDQTKTEAFQKWFGDSKVVDAEGKPLVVYHGTSDPNFGTFKYKSGLTGVLGHWFAGTAEAANQFAKQRYAGIGPGVFPVYLSIQHPKVYDGWTEFVEAVNSFRNGRTIEDGSKSLRRSLMMQGHDGIILRNSTTDSGGLRDDFVAFNNTQIKSATGNRGTFDPTNPSINFLKSRIIGDAGRQYTPAQKAAMQRTGSVITQKSIQETVKHLWKDAGKKLAQGLVDQFRPVRDLSAHAYTLLRLSKGATGAFEAFMKHGKLSLNDGAYDADTSGGVIDTVFVPLGRESTDFLRWVAGNRAERLTAEGKEHLFTQDDIDAFKSLADGTTDQPYTMADGSTTKDRTLIYRDSLKKFNEFNKNVLDMAEQSGLIDGDSRHLWEHEFYVPFYRTADDEDGGVRGMNIKSGVVRQEAFKQLKGGEQQLNDLLENTLMNWAHLIDASAKNRAAKATLQAAVKVKAAYPAQPGAKHTVWHMGEKPDGTHGKVEYTVNDPYLLDAINSLEYAGLKGPAMQAMSMMKHALTVGVTASPFFKVRNLIRDSVQAIATSDLSYNPLGNIAKGIKLTNRDSQSYVSALAGGGLIRFGTMLEGSEAKRTRQLIAQGSKDTSILDSPKKVKAFYDKVISPAIDAYNELGNRGEEINRMTLYDTLIKQGKSHAEASLLARDLLDFSMQGTWTAIRFLTQVVPFANARAQGLYKLGRAAHDDPARFAIVLGATAMASLALLAAYQDDDDWKRREDFDRDGYWWFKIGGEAFRIPKPFEIGAIATLAERSAELMTDPEMTPARFAQRVLSLTSNQLAMNPIPQAVKPMIDLYANQDSFTNRPIETMGMERLAPTERYRPSTSLVARGLSTAGNAMTGDHFASPVQIDHLAQAYFGWLGSFVVGSADMLIRGASNEPTRPALDYWKVATGGMVAGTEGAHSRYLTQMYEQARELETAHATWRHLLKDGKIDEAKDYREAHTDELNRYRRVEHVKTSATKLNERIRMIERSTLSPTEKREKINAIRSQQETMARSLVPH